MAKTRVGIRNGALVPPSSGIITDGLVLNLDASNTLSYPGTGTDWFDLTSNNNDGVLLNGASYVTDGGGSISFDGVNDYVRIPKITNNVYSLNIWYKMGINDGTYGYLGGNDSNKGFAISEGGSYGGLSYGEFYYYDSKQPHSLGFISSTTEWVNVSTIIDTTLNNIKVYCNGVLISNNTVNLLSTDITLIGVYYSGAYYNYLNGKIGSYNIYNRTLTDSEVLQNYNATKDRFGL